LLRPGVVESRRTGPAARRRQPRQPCRASTSSPPAD